MANGYRNERETASPDNVTKPSWAALSRYRRAASSESAAEPPEVAKDEESISGFVALRATRATVSAIPRNAFAAKKHRRRPSSFLTNNGARQGHTSGRRIPLFKLDAFSQRRTMQNLSGLDGSVLYTAKNYQLVVMSLHPGEEIGMEVHWLDQFFRVEEGSGEAILDGVHNPVNSGFAVLVPAGTQHNIDNAGATPLKLYTLYANGFVQALDNCITQQRRVR